MKNADPSRIDIDDISDIKSFLDKAGPLIKATRKQKGLSTEELADKLRIGEEQLLAIENCQGDLLPEDVFIKAMIRRIFEKLNLNIDIMNESSKKVSGITTSNRSQQRLRANQSKMPVFLVAIISLTLGILWPRVFMELLKDPKQKNAPISQTSKIVNYASSKLMN